MASHSLAGFFFLLLAAVLTWPLPAHLTSQIPGSGAGDNVAFLWNFWWMRQALASSTDAFFHTRVLFYPVGVDLTLHTHTALNAFLGATILRPVSIVTAQNVILIVSYALNGFAAYALAWRTTRHRGASVLAGVFFASSPYMSGHLHGHFNLVAAWGVPFFALAMLRALDTGSTGMAAVSGALLAAVAFTDYYYVVYLGAFTLCVLAWRWVDATCRACAWRAQDGVDAALVSVFALLLGALAFIGITGGGVFAIGPVQVKMTNGFNARTAAWVVALVWGYRRWRPAVHFSLARPGSFRRDARAIGVMSLVFCAASLPLIVNAWQLWRAGGYVSQRYFWRSAPEGVDLLSLVSGNPFHPMWGTLVARVYTARHLNAIESTAWLGLAPMVLLWTTRSEWIRRQEARLWLTVACVFFVWALGPRLAIAGLDTGLFLPQVLLRFVPIVANARIPGRAIVMVYLAAAVLLAIATAHSRVARLRWAPWALCVAVLVDFAAAPFPMYTLDRPALYDRLAARPSGAVIELPFGVRDGFGEEGRLDHRTLYYQSVHGKPLAGGFAARLPEPVKAFYRTSPVLGPLLRLSAGESLEAEPAPDAREVAATFFNANDIRYIVLNTTTAGGALQRYVTTTLPVVRVDTSDERELYVVR